MALKVAEPAVLRKVTNVVVYILDLTLPISFRKWKGVRYLVCILHFLYQPCICACIEPDMCASKISIFAVAEIAVDECHMSLCQCSSTSSKLLGSDL